MERSLEPELLDTLPPDHPDALHNRRDIRLTNQAMGNYRWLSRTILQLHRRGERVLEIGAGTGELGSQLARLGVVVDGLDLWPRPAAWPRSATWHQSDIREFTHWAEYAVVIGNLIFHQFHTDELQQLGRQLATSARVIIACEPLRSRTSQVLYRTFAPLFGANYVSLHDAHVSIAAGFRDQELVEELGLDTAGWHVEAESTFRGAYHLVARRRTP